MEGNNTILISHKAYSAYWWILAQDAKELAQEPGYHLYYADFIAMKEKWTIHHYSLSCLSKYQTSQIVCSWMLIELFLSQKEMWKKAK